MLFVGSPTNVGVVTVWGVGGAGVGSSVEQRGDET